AIEGTIPTTDANQCSHAPASTFGQLLNFFGGTYNGFADSDLCCQTLHERCMFFGDILLAFLTVVPSRIEIFLLEPFGHQIKRQALNMNSKSGKSVSKQMGFE